MKHITYTLCSAFSIYKLLRILLEQKTINHHWYHICLCDGQCLCSISPKQSKHFFAIFSLTFHICCCCYNSSISTMFQKKCNVRNRIVSIVVVQSGLCRHQLVMLAVRLGNTNTTVWKTFSVWFVVHSSSS